MKKGKIDISPNVTDLLIRILTLESKVEGLERIVRGYETKKQRDK